MEELSVDEKVKIASGFLLASPPGEVNDVFNGTLREWRGKKKLGLVRMVSWCLAITLIDVRTLVANDDALQDGILEALEQYNTEQHITVVPPGVEHEVSK